MSISIYEKMADINNINIFMTLCISIISVAIAMKLFYNKSINNIDTITLDF